MKLVDFHCEQEISLLAPRSARAVLFLDGAFVTTVDTMEKMGQLRELTAVDIVGAVGSQSTSRDQRYWCRIDACLRDWQPAPMPLRETDILHSTVAIAALATELAALYSQLVVVGYSQGALIALLAQRLAPQCLSKIVAVCPATVRNHPYVSASEAPVLLFPEHDTFSNANMRAEIAAALGAESVVIPNHGHQWSFRLAQIVAQYINSSFTLAL
jgi:predicted esterase